MEVLTRMILLQFLYNSPTSNNRPRMLEKYTVICALLETAGLLMFGQIPGRSPFSTMKIDLFPPRSALFETGCFWGILLIDS